MSEALTVLDLIHRWGAERPDRTAFRFLRSDESVGEELSYAALRRNTLAIARALSACAPPGSRALLLFETEPGFVHAFFGCLAAQVLAVPADPPHGRRAWGGIDRIVSDCQPATILTTRTLQQRWERQLGPLCAAHACRVLTIEDCLSAGDGDGRPAAVPATIDAARVAFLQYTSGSTSHPKGVMVTHDNILANLRMIQEAFSLDADTQTVSWLPLFHDMGLIGFVLEPVYLGCTSTILSPTAFLERPVRLLRAITRYRGTISSSPNFAYDLCCAKIRPEEREGLELSSWRCALNGSEPVSARTISRFLETFADRGLPPTAFRPCYGMAETTLLISASDANRPIRLLPAPEDDEDRPALADAAFRIETTDVVGCGRPPRGTVIRIVDPVTRVGCAAGQVGEVWFQGKNVAAGYWENPAATEEGFGARLTGDEGGPYLRTGDLGCLDEGELFLMGRMKELIIIRGRNFPPPDIEAAVAGAHEAIRAGHVAAVGLVHETGQDLGVIAEIEREHWRTFDPQAVVDAILEAIHAEFGLGVAVVTLLRPGGIPKTTSGKLKRLECGRRLRERAASDWGVLHEWRLPVPAARDTREAGVASDAAAASGPRPVVDGLEKAELTDVVLHWLRTRLGQALACRPDDIADEEPFARCGLDSAVAVTLTGELAEWLRLDLDPTVFWEHAHPLALAEHLAGQVAERAGAGDPVEQI